MIERHAHLARVVACQLLPGLPKSLDLEDLVGAGYIGLIEAVDGFDASRGLAFSTWAMPRIRSRILDYLRAEDRLSRRERERVRLVETAQRMVMAATGAEATDEGLAAELGWEIEALCDHEAAMELSQTLSLSNDRFPILHGPVAEGKREPATLADRLVDEEPSPLDEVLTMERKLAVAMAWDRLPERERMLLDHYYREGKTFREIAPLLGCGEARVWQIHEQALQRIRGMLAPDQALWE